MACPFFHPASPLTGMPGEAMPLGDFYGGECAAQKGALIALDLLRECCNRGYARTTCERAATSDEDAYRFLIKAQSGGTVEVSWSLERNHHPVAVGVTSIGGTKADTETPLESQARAYAAAYLRQGQPKKRAR
jgi:hypothetical protein